MNKILSALLLLICMFAFSSCDLFEDPVQVVPDNDVETDIEVDVTLSKNVSYTFNGFNLKYKIESTSLKVGETMKITIDSENEIKPLVKLVVNDVEVLSSSELPYEYSCVVEKEGEYSVEFNVFDAFELLQFTLKTAVSVSVDVE